MRLGLWAAALSLCSASAAQAKTFFSIPADYEKINSPTPEVVVANPFPKIKGKQINGVKFSFDGSWYEAGCSTEDRGGSKKVCGKPKPIQPGAHVFYAVMCTKEDCSKFGEAWTIKQKITIGIRERVIVDLAKEGAVTRKSLEKEKPSPCVAAIEKAFYENTCRADGVKKFAQRIDELHQTCSSSWSKNTDLLLELATWQASYVYPERCYYNDEIQRLPRFLTEWTMTDGFWPPGTLGAGVSSWSWARQPEEDFFAKYSGQKFRDKVKAWVKAWAARQEVVDQLIDVALNPAAGIPALASASAQAKFDMNPKTPAGHRNFGLSVLAQGDSNVAKDARVQKVLSQGAAKGGGKSGQAAAGGKVHCALSPEADNLVRAMLADQDVSADDWAAIQGFMKRTPADKKMSGCTDIIDAGLKGVPAGTRFLTMAFYDCAKGRDPEVRGKTISSAINPIMAPSLVPPAERLKVLKKFRDCVAYENGVDGEKVVEKTVKGFDFRRYSYETGDLRKIEAQEHGNNNGKSLYVFYRPDGVMTRINCGPMSKDSVADCKPNFPFDLNQLPTLTK